jgi:predicted nuclease of predicted toxin-antitoxin system
MRLLLDMNLSPAWVDFLEAEGWETVHWHAVGEPNAPDGEIMVWARDHGYYVVTNGLDFSAILAATRAEGPSVVQIRAQDWRRLHWPRPWSRYFVSTLPTSPRCDIDT